MSFAALAIKTLLADGGKFTTALVGVVFSVVLVNLQGGLFLGLIHKAATLVDNSQADIWVGHKQMHNVDFARDIPRRWLHRVQGIPDVALVEPYLVGFSDMSLPSGNYENVVVVGVQRDGTMGRPWNLQAGTPLLEQPHAILVDICDGDKMEYPRVGELREIGGRRTRVVGQTNGITGFLVTPYVFASYNQALTILGKDARTCSYFLVKLAAGADAEKVCRQIRERVPELDAYPRQRFSEISQHFWLTRTGIGISFGAATLIGLLVALVMVAQTLYASVLDRVAEFAAMKAMGASDHQIFKLLGIQAVLMAIIGTLAGLLVVIPLHAMFSTPRASIEIPFWLSSGGFGLVITICLIAAWLPYQRVRKIDPLSVLQGG